MEQKPLALIVEDDPNWINIFESVLENKFHVKKAKTLGEVTTLVEDSANKFDFALVDIRLEGKSDRSGLDVLHLLRSKDILSITTTAYYDSDVQAIRDALVVGGARDCWFKSKQNTVDLRDLIDRLLVEQESRTEMISRTGRRMIEGGLLQFFLALIGFPLVIFAILTAVVLLIPENLVIAVVTSGITMVILLVVSFALFINKVTGEQFTDLVKELLKRNDSSPSDS